MWQWALKLEARRTILASSQRSIAHFNAYITTPWLASRLSESYRQTISHALSNIKPNHHPQVSQLGRRLEAWLTCVTRAKCEYRSRCDPSMFTTAWQLDLLFSLCFLQGATSIASCKSNVSRTAVGCSAYSSFAPSWTSGPAFFNDTRPPSMQYMLCHRIVASVRTRKGDRTSVTECGIKPLQSVGEEDKQR